MSIVPLRIASSASPVGLPGAAPRRGKARSIALACALGASALLGGCASYGYGGGYGGYGYGGSGYYGGTPYGYSGSAYDYGYGGYGSYGYPYGSYYGGYGGYYGYPYGYGYPYRPRPPQNHTPRPQDPTAGNGVIGTPPPWRDPARRNARLNGQPIPSAGERPVLSSPEMGGRGRIQPSIQAPQEYRRSGRDVMRAGPAMGGSMPRMERSAPRIERSAPRMERDAPRARGGDAFGGRRERDGGLEQTP